MRNSILWAGLIALMAVMPLVMGGGQVMYPDGYRNWAHIKSMVILPGHSLEDPFGGIHHVYANDKAVKGLGTGNYADGAVIVFDLLEYQEGGNALQEGPRKLVGVMEYDGKRYSKTGGWGFEGFAGSSRTERLTNDGGQSCYECHTSVKETQFVFSKLRD